MTSSTSRARSRSAADLEEPGRLADLSLGLPGDAEPLPPDDARQKERTAVNAPDAVEQVADDA